MKKPSVSIVIPTITGRERWLRSCLDAYRETTPWRYELIVIRNRFGCGDAWNEGAYDGDGEFIHFSADDLIPHPGWAEAALEVVREGKMPCPLVLEPNGAVQSCGAWGELQPDGSPTDIARVPFLSREQWMEIGPIPPGWHYYTDNYIAEAGARKGIETVVSHGYCFTHHFAPEGRLGHDQMVRDLAKMEDWRDLGR